MSRPPLVTLRATSPPMGERDGNSELIRLVQHTFRSRLESDGVYGPRTRAVVADWQWRTGAPNHAGAITPDELVVLLGYRHRPAEWRKRAAARQGMENPAAVVVPARRALEIVPASEWNPLTPRRPHAAAPWYPGIPHVIHWFGPGVAAEDDDAGIAMNVGFARYHQLTLGWNYYAYSLAVLRSGLVLDGRGANARTAATGNQTANAYPSILVLCGTGTPTPTEIQLDVLATLRERYGWGRRYNHLEFTSTACPGPDLSAWVNSHR